MYLAMIREIDKVCQEEGMPDIQENGTVPQAPNERYIIAD
jgi:hypothetical protein